MGGRPDLRYDPHGGVDVAVIVDGCSRLVVGGHASCSRRTDLPRHAGVEMALWARRARRVPGLIHHRDRGVQERAIRSTERVAEAGVVASAGSRGDSSDNAL